MYVCHFLQSGYFQPKIFDDYPNFSKVKSMINKVFYVISAAKRVYKTLQRVIIALKFIYLVKIVKKTIWTPTYGVTRWLDNAMLELRQEFKDNSFLFISLCKNYLNCINLFSFPQNDYRPFYGPKDNLNMPLTARIGSLKLWKTILHLFCHYGKLFLFFFSFTLQGFELSKITNPFCEILSNRLTS